MIQCDRKLNILTENELDIYQREGYLHLKNIIPDELLNQTKKPLSHYVDNLIYQWYIEGKINSLYEEYSWLQRLNVAWVAASKPPYSRSPRSEIVSPEVFNFLKFNKFVSIAQDLIDSPNIAAHGIFNYRPKLPNQHFTDTPWHQDAQYFRNSFDSNIITMWIPFIDVDESNSCLMVAPGHHNDNLYDNYSDPVSGFTGLKPEDRQGLNGKSIHMKKGDVLCFNQKMPHLAMPNKSDSVRWSFDIRYEACDAANSIALDNGFICSHDDPNQIETSYKNWYDCKWKDHKGY
jgi:phytanoyl-CoA hydroxylase